MIRVRPGIMKSATILVPRTRLERFLITVSICKHFSKFHNFEKIFFTFGKTIWFCNSLKMCVVLNNLIIFTTPILEFATPPKMLVFGTPRIRYDRANSYENLKLTLTLHIHIFTRTKKTCLASNSMFS